MTAAAPKRPRGRPRVPDAERRERVSVSLSRAELREVDALRRRLREPSRSSLLRRLVRLALDAL